MRRLLVIASTMVLFDVAFYSAIAPLLPDYVSDLGLSKAEAGVLSAAYAAGTLLASLPAGFMATRAGPRPTVLSGLALLGVSSLVFGFAGQIDLLDLARFSQGVAGALVWAGAMTWLITTAPSQRRGAIIGTVVGTAVAGALIGPALGALAGEVGTEPVFGAVLGIAAIFAVMVLRTPAPGPPERQALGEVLEAMLARPVVVATAFVTVPSLMFGAIEVLVPLQIADFGGGHGTIAAGFVAGAAVEAVLAPLVGRHSDRVGRRAPFVGGLAVAAAGMLVLAVAGTVGVVIAGLLILSMGAGICFTPALAMLSETAESGELRQGFASGLSNMAWATGQVLGGLAGGVLAGLGGYAVPSLGVAGLVLLTAAYALRRDLPGPAVQAVGAE
jgi:MFS family permease